MLPYILAFLLLIVILAVIFQVLLLIYQFLLSILPILFILALAVIAWSIFGLYYRQKAPIHIEKTSLSNQTAEILDLSIKECGCVYAYEKAPESKLVNEAEVWVRESKGAMTMFHRASLEVYRCVKCGRYHYKHDMLDEKREIWPEDAKIEPEDDLPILSLEDIKKAEGEVVQSLIQDKGIEQSRYHSMEGLGDELS